MSKEKWHSKMIHIITILAMTVTMLVGSAMPAFGADAVDIEINDVDITVAGIPAIEDFADPPLEVEINVDLTNAEDEVDYTFEWEYKQNPGDLYCVLDPDDPTDYLPNCPDLPLLFADDLDRSFPNVGADEITETWMLNVPGWYRVTVTVDDDDNISDPFTETAEIRVLGIIPEDIAFDAKGGQQKICVKGLSDAYQIEWDLVSGVELEPADIIVKVPGTGDPSDPETWDKVGWLEQYQGGQTGQELVQGQPCIHIEALARGDIHIYATVSGDPLGIEDGNGTPSPPEDIRLHTEKKWGELHHSILDLDADTPGIQGPTEYVTIQPLEMGLVKETIEDTIYATFYEVTDPMRVGHAIVHWWLFEDTKTIKTSSTS
jgi:hypothetical protein